MEKNLESKPDPALLSAIIDGMEDVKARNINVLNLQNLENSICDYFCYLRRHF
ncbi:MAG: hypothetical protein U5L96_13660 [Owenweeksia sp.]|nr:hypothetical protein [Owenweeksia sp.]